MSETCKVSGFIYARMNELCDMHDCYKLGTTRNIPDREANYITGEINRGSFKYVYEIQGFCNEKCEQMLFQELKRFNLYKNAGTEFYRKDAVKYIEPFFNKHYIKYKKLSAIEIANLVRTDREYIISNESDDTKTDSETESNTDSKADNNDIDNDTSKYIISNENSSRVAVGYDSRACSDIVYCVARNDSTQSNYLTHNDVETKIISSNALMLKEPYKYQKDVLDNIQNYYFQNNIGKLIWACGLGKTLMTLYIINIMKFKSIIIGVPSTNLQKQWIQNILNMGQNKDSILLIGGDEYENIKRAVKYTREDISIFIKKYKAISPVFIISTYHSCSNLVDENICVDFKVGDEAHHLVGVENENNKGFRKFHKITSVKSIYLTATEKIIDTDNDTIVENKSNKYSMNDEAIFGKYIDIKSVKWAIDNNKITDYNVLVIKNTIDEVDHIIRTLKINVKDKTIFISCYMCLKSLEKYEDLTHILLYTNTVKEAEQAKKYIDDILSLNIISIDKEKIYNNALHSNNNETKNKLLDKEINKFKNMQYGIISCIYIFGEGFDMPKLNGVCIASNMKSIIRIVQYLLRPNRLESGNPLKKAYQIIPYIDNDNWGEENNKSYENVRNIISQMRNVDENIEHKIKVLTQEYDKKEDADKKYIQPNYNNFNENDNELCKLKLRLRYSKSLHSNFTEEEDEYNYVRSINISLNIKSKYEYINSEDKHANYISNPEDYFKSKGVWKNWYHFYGNDTNNYVSKDELIKICKKNNVRSSEDYIKLCESHEELPKEPAEYYRDFTNLKNELGLFNRRK
jgi:superfamily II DNA or RNA helicase